MRRLRSQPARRARRRGHRGSRGGQGLVEFALVAPLLVFVVFGTIDVGRLMYTYNAISSASREGARLISLKPQFDSDCDPLHRMETVGQAFPLLQDPNSIDSATVNVDPNTVTPPTGSSAPGHIGQTLPPPGQGYIYIYPAVASDTSGTAPGCDPPGAQRLKPCQSCVQDV